MRIEDRGVRESKPSSNLYNVGVALGPCCLPYLSEPAVSEVVTLSLNKSAGQVLREVVFHC